MYYLINYSSSMNIVYFIIDPTLLLILLCGNNINSLAKERKKPYLLVNLFVLAKDNL